MSPGQSLERGSVSDVGAHSVRGVLWTLSGQWGAQVLRVLSIVVMARLLTPDDYGLVAEVTAVTGLIGVAGSLGLSEAVVQSKTVTHEQASALFWVNAAFGAFLALLVAALGPVLAAFYGRTEVAAIAVALSLTFLISGVTVQHQALMLRQLRFKSVATRTLLTTAIGLGTSVVLAALGAGYWSLVAGQLASAVTAAVVTWSAVPWRPSRPARADGLRGLLSFGGGISTFRVLDYASKNADNVIIGNALGAGQLGLYTRGYGLLMLPLSQIHAPVANVVRPTLAGLWPEPERYRRYYLTALGGLCYLVMPVVAVLAVMAGPVVEVLLGPKWLSSVEVFRWLAIAGFLQVVGNTNGWLYATSGRAWAMARWGLVSRPLLICAFLVGVHWGITGVAISYAAAQLVLTPIGIVRAGRGTPVNLSHVLRVAMRPAVLAAYAGLAALTTTHLLRDQSPTERLVLGSLAAGVAFAVTAVAWPSARQELLRLLAAVRGRKRGPSGPSRPASGAPGPARPPAPTEAVPATGPSLTVAGSQGEAG